MLVLHRGQSERVFIGDSVCVTVVKTTHGHLVLGIDAPKDVVILRGELMPPIEEELRLAKIRGSK